MSSATATTTPHRSDPYDCTASIEEDESEDEDESEAARLEALLKINEKAGLRNLAVDERMEQLTCAAVALNLDDSVRM